MTVNWTPVSIEPYKFAPCAKCGRPGYARYNSVCGDLRIGCSEHRDAIFVGQSKPTLKAIARSRAAKWNLRNIILTAYVGRYA